MVLENLSILLSQYINNRGNFRNYTHQQLLLSYAPVMLKQAQKLLPNLKLEHIKLSEKVGIRPQLFNIEKKEMEDDFLLIDGYKSTHILNAISPAFTASFSFADFVIKKIKFN